MHPRPGEDKLLLGLMALIVWLPIPLGSNRQFYWSISEIWIALLLLIWMFQYARGRRRIPEAARRAWPALLVLGLWLAWLVLQIVPLPVGLVEWLSPKAAWLHRLTFHPGDGPLRVTLSVEPYSTLVGLHKSIAYVLLFLLVLLLVRRFTHLRWVAMAVVASGLLQAVLGILGYLAGWDTMYWPGGRELTASFANRNHLANYLTLSLAVGIGLLLAQMGEGGGRDAKENLRRALDWIMSGRMRLRIYLLLMTAALIMTRSRMGNTAFFVSLLIAGPLTLLLVRRKSHGMVVLLASLVVIDVMIMGSLIGIDRVVERLEKTSLESENRDEVARDTLVYWREHPVTGSGLGTFRTTYPRYKRGDVRAAYRQTHNDYLQFAAETGTVGLGLIGSFVLLTLLVTLRTLRRRRMPWSLGIAFAVLMGSVALMIHSTVEFNLQIFANAALYMVIAGLGWVAAHLPVTRESRRRRHRGRRRRVVAVLSALAILLYQGWVAAAATASLISGSNRLLLKQLAGGGEVSQARLQRAMRRQLTAIRLAPGSADAKLVLSRLLDWRIRPGGDTTLSGREREAVYQQMLYLLLGATVDSPGLAQAWEAIAYVRHAEGRFDALFQAALLRTTQLAPWEPRVQQDMARIGLDAWELLGRRQSRALVLDTVRRGLLQDPGPMIDLIRRGGHRQLVCGRLDPAVTGRLCAPDHKPR